MPRYYFDVHDGTHLTPDDQGLELDSLEQAQKEAVKALPEVARDVLPNGSERTFTITVKDEMKRPVLSAKLALTVDRL